MRDGEESGTDVECAIAVTGVGYGFVWLIDDSSSEQEFCSVYADAEGQSSLVIRFSIYNGSISSGCLLRHA